MEFAHQLQLSTMMMPGLCAISSEFWKGWLLTNRNLLRTHVSWKSCFCFFLTPSCLSAIELVGILTYCRMQCCWSCWSNFGFGPDMPHWKSKDWFFVFFFRFLQQFPKPFPQLFFKHFPAAISVIFFSAAIFVCSHFRNSFFRSHFYMQPIFAAVFWQIFVRSFSTAHVCSIIFPQPFLQQFSRRYPLFASNFQQHLFLQPFLHQQPSLLQQPFLYAAHFRSSFSAAIICSHFCSSFLANICSQLFHSHVCSIIFPQTILAAIFSQISFVRSHFQQHLFLQPIPASTTVFCSSHFLYAGHFRSSFSRSHYMQPFLQQSSCKYLFADFSTAMSAV